MTLINKNMVLKMQHMHTCKQLFHSKFVLYERYAMMKGNLTMKSDWMVRAFSVYHEPVKADEHAAIKHAITSFSTLSSFIKLYKFHFEGKLLYYCIFLEE